MTKDTNIQHKDLLGRNLAVGDAVCYPVSNSLVIGTVTKLNPKMIKVKKVGSKSLWGSEVNKYPVDIIKLDSSEITFYLLQNS